MQRTNVSVYQKPTLKRCWLNFCRLNDNDNNYKFIILKDAHVKYESCFETTKIYLFLRGEEYIKIKSVVRETDGGT